jgi:cytochrome c oxidase subunit 2
MKPFPFVLLILCISLLAGCESAESDALEGGAIEGADLAVMKGCMACHAIDDSVKIGPSWLGLFGSQVSLDDGTTILADEAYLKESILAPDAKIVQGYSPYSMPVVDLTPSEVQILIDYIKAVK